MKKVNKILFINLICFALIIMVGIDIIVSAQQQDTSEISIEGIWQGKLKVPGTELRVVFKISKNPDGTLTATLDSPDQGVTGIPVEEVIFEDNTLRLEVKSAGAVFEGKVSEDFLVIEGEWKQSGGVFPLTVKRVDKAIEILRPQVPKKPYPYTEEEVAYENKEAGITLAGTLTLPSGKGPSPAVLLISGSGPQDRNETIYNHHPFLVLADYLTRQGIAVLRVDDRGVGESTGDFSQATSVDFASDVLAGIEYLKTRKEINPEQIGLIGHSEGGLIAPMVAVKSPDVAFIILMAGTGLTGEEILYLQGALISRAMGVSEEDIAKNRQFNEKIFSLIKEESIGYHLSPVYDLVNSRLVLPEEREEMCLSLQGKKNRFSRKNFIKLAEHFGLTNKQSANSLVRLHNITPAIEKMIEESFLNERLKDRFLEIYRKRLERIFR